jgi:hypothetical protein
MSEHGLRTCCGVYKAQGNQVTLWKGHGDSTLQSPPPDKPHMRQEPLVTTVTVLLGTLRATGQGDQGAPGSQGGCSHHKEEDIGLSSGPGPEEQGLTGVSCGRWILNELFHFIQVIKFVSMEFSMMSLYGAFPIHLTITVSLPS